MPKNMYSDYIIFLRLKNSINKIIKCGSRNENIINVISVTYPNSKNKKYKEYI